ncbi:MAG: hypothetical protein LUC45_07010 [Paraprevotella sp.]|nr:hypothetical protein [Paraprevotella sp.]
MNTEYPTATRLLIEDVLSIGSVQDNRIEQRLREYYLDSTMQVLLEDVHSKYKDLTPEETELSSVFHQIKASDPEFKIPFMYAQISGLNQSFVVGDSMLGISLDKYLGEDYPLYRKYYHDYQRRMMDRSRLVSDASFYYLSHEYPIPESRVHTLLDYIVDYGKLQWVIARCRNISLEQEAGFDNGRAAWYRKNEGRVWKWMNEHQTLFSSDLTMIRLFMEPRGHTVYISQDSPDQIGQWLGLQIIDHYMKSHPDLTIGQLLHKEDYQEILRESGYNPIVTDKHD